MTIRHRFDTEGSDAQDVYRFFLCILPRPIIPPSIPSCQTCQTKGTLRYVLSGNPNGNGGRPYYVCPRCPQKTRWIRWEDNKGVNAANPPCDCGKPSRQDRIGTGHAVVEARAGLGFWTCAEGECEYYSEHLNGDVGKAVAGEGFMPWLLEGTPHGQLVSELPSF